MSEGSSRCRGHAGFWQEQGSYWKLSPRASSFGKPEVLVVVLGRPAALDRATCSILPETFHIFTCI